MSKVRTVRAKRAPLTAHPAFRRILIAWLAALAGLGVLVLTNHPLWAAGAAVLGATLGWIVARLAFNTPGKTRSPAETGAVPELSAEPAEIEPSRPAFMHASELGVASLDAEVGSAEPCLVPAPKPDITDSGLEEPVELEPGKGAATVLKSQPIEQMSLVEMIERFAHALEDKREQADRRGNRAGARLPDPKLVETLRALPIVNAAPLRQYATHGNLALAASTAEQADETERALREALEKLQRMSGGA